MIKPLTRTFVIFSLLIGVGCSSKSEEAPSSNIIAGKALVKKHCKVCHAQGINGAPIIGNRTMWAPRVVKGKDQLVHNAINGFGLMPAKAGNPNLTEADINLAVDYMLKQVDNK